MQKLQLLYNSFDKYRLQDARSFLEVLLSASSFNFPSIGKGWNKEAAIFQALEIFFLGREILFLVPSRLQIRSNKLANCSESQ